MKPVAPTAPLLADSCLAFQPVPQQRRRADGWTPEIQANFIRALAAMGSVGKAARAVGMGRASAYRLRERPEAASFAAAWDRAITMGRTHQFSIAMDRALNGVTIVRVLKGGAVDVSSGPDMAVVHAALRDEAVPPHLLKATKETE
ncbi:protein of unknown function [uncultured Sphingopyxis sp.]|uniref:LysR family transcriptional regulator n=1 Tax=uncultured Sphingopyxis sp. TaxID=310581 RepID=A0A1Y5Q103_9SPHN|nr:hypothetical protein [uncultured Sphingopyxis sp.]SBV34576.1 protein of unknown function [uncultured Sphingopyxis sp.]